VPESDPLAWLSSLEGVPTAYAGCRDGIDILLRDRGLRRTSPEQTGESLLRGAYASAVLEGSSSAPDKVLAGEMDDTAAASIRVSTELLSLVPVLAKTPPEAFARLHTLAGKGTVEDDRLGRPVSAEASDRLGALSNTLLTTSQPALLVAALVHAELIAISAFASHNGIIARAVERLILVSRGVDPASLIVPEAGHLGLRKEYESNLRGYQSGRRAGLHSWLLYAAEAYTLGAESSPLNT
jgi:hypothetical protein